MNVSIVGAGIVGCAIAHELTSRGARVRVIDPRGTAQGATRASAGMLAPYIEGHSSALLRLTICSLSLYDELIARVRVTVDQPPEYERTGTLQVARDDAEAAELAVAAASLVAAEVPHTLLDGAEARRLEPALSEAVTAALLIPEHGYVAASALASALAEAASRRGATFSIGRVVGVSGSDAGARVATVDEIIESDAVIIAAGSWSAGVSGVHTSPPPVKPIRGQLVHLRGAARAASRVIWGSGCYLVSWRDGSVLVGATVEDVGFDETSTAAGVERLIAAAIDVLPQLGGARFHEVRVGLRPKTADELPAIGPSSTMPRVFYATGHYRNGVLLAPLTASLVADLVLDGRERAELALTRPARLGL